MKRILLAVLLFSFFVLGGCGRNEYTVIAWNDLGMHCIDHDYSVFAILPPYNNLHAQLIDRKTGKPVSTGVSLTYEATWDTRGSINTTSKTKTNFWQWATSLFKATPRPDVGLAGNRVQSRTPSPMTYNAAAGYWIAEGVPAVPYDDAGKANYYPMVKVVAKDGKGNILAATKTVLPVSDEMTCVHCHTSGTGDPMAQPSPDWVYDPNPEKDWKRNILLLHDNKNMGKPLYDSALAAGGYSAAGIAANADAGSPVLCADCHASNALGKNGVAGIKQLTTSIHSWHAMNAMDDNTGQPLDYTMDRTGCYYCHPGSATLCLRGVMGKAKKADGTFVLECQNCHGPMSKVGATDRIGWVDLPKCQNCHYWSDEAGSYVRDTSAFDAAGNFRSAVSSFSTGTRLYKMSAEHGMQCQACHGPTHAEYPSAEANDNVQSIGLQDYAGTVTECGVCHMLSLPIPSSGGPHNIHTVGQLWVYSHTKAAKTNAASCAVCHGRDYRGTMLSKTATERNFTTTGSTVKTFAQGQPVSCYDCHAKLAVL